jgi:hypothetical protein
MRKLKVYAVVLGIGAILGIAVAETWRRKMLHDSYTNYLPPPLEEEVAPAPGARPGGRVRGVAKGAWRPVAASARTQVIRIRRIRLGAPPPTVEAPVAPEAQPEASVLPVDEQP